MRKIAVLLFFCFTGRAVVCSAGYFLSEIEDDIEAKMKARLQIYEAENIHVSYDKDSPRKLVKNVIVPKNGYYRLEFYSKKEKLKYSCDLTYARNIPDKRNRNQAYPFVMNCKNENDSSVFPTQVKRLFESAFPGKAKPKSIEVSGGSSVAPLVDNFSYEIKYESSADGTSYNCKAFLNMAQQPHELVDQELVVTSCEKMFPKTVNPFSLRAAPVPCSSDVGNFGSIGSTFSGLYDFTDRKLNQIKPMPQKDEVSCDINSIDYWQSFADKMVALDKIKLKSKNKESAALETAVLQNALINQAYNRLYMKSRQADGVSDSLQWLAVASQSSPIVGKTLRMSYLNSAEPIAINDSPGIRNVTANDERFFENSGSLTKAAVERGAVALQTAKGNLNVFKDMYWQNFAAAFCGVEKARDLNKLLKDKYLKTGEKEKAAHYANLENAWIQIANGNKAIPKNEKQIKDGNLQLLWLEQHDILQDQMYGSKEAKLVNQIGIFNSIAKTNFQDPKSPATTFVDFCKHEKMSCSLSNFESRFAWMKNIVENQLDYVKSLNATGTTKAVYYPALDESYEILSDYK